MANTNQSRSVIFIMSYRKNRTLPSHREATSRLKEKSRELMTSCIQTSIPYRCPLIVCVARFP